MPTIPNPALDYARAVLAGEIVAGELVRLACQRHLDDLRDGHKRGLRFDIAAGNRSIAFSETFLHHTKGKWAKGGCTCPDDIPNCPTRKRLEPWQKFIRAALFGWMRKGEDGLWLRRFRLALELVARKNGKSEDGGDIGLYMVDMDNEPSAEVYAAATKRDQAKIIHDRAKAMVQKGPGLSHLTIYQNNIHNLSTFSKFEPLGADHNTMDGLSGHCLLLDELHAHPTRQVFDVLETSMGAREQPLLLALSTAGEIRRGQSVCKELRDYCEQVLRGKVEDDGLFAFIAELDPGDDWKDEANWPKANPNLGVSKSYDYMRGKLGRAKRLPAAETAFRMKELNEWVDQAAGWLPAGEWAACSGEVDPLEMYGRPCFGGLDMSYVRDLTAFVLVFPPHGEDAEWAVLAWYWCPQAMIDQRAISDRAIIGWSNQGLVEATAGNVVDYETVEERIADLANVYAIQEIGFDPWNATAIATRLMGRGLQLVQVRQGYKTLSEPLRFLERLVLDRELRHGGNPVLEWNVGNVAMRMDANENIAPDKSRSADRIDGLSALATGISRAFVHEGPQRSKYEDEDVLEVG